MYIFLMEERLMTEANEMVAAVEVPRRGQSLLSTLKRFMEGLDYDPELYVHASLKELMDSVPQLEARLALLEKHEGNNSAPVIRHTKERK
jgi:hypothetical protein